MMRRNYGSLDLAALDLQSPCGNAANAGASPHTALAQDLAHLQLHGDSSDMMDAVDDSDCEWDLHAQPRSVGFPIELFAHMHDGGESDDDVASHILQLHDRVNAPRRRKRSLSDHGTAQQQPSHHALSMLAGTRRTAPLASSSMPNAPVATTATTTRTHQHQHISGATELSPRLPIKPSPPDHLQQQKQQRHALELHALRCLNLNLMLSSSVPSGSKRSSNVTAPATALQPSMSVPKMSSFELGCQPQDDCVSTPALFAGRRGSLTRNMIQSV